MKHFAALFTELDSTTSTNAKVLALQEYFQAAAPADAAWAVYFLSGGKPRQVVKTAMLRTLACEAEALRTGCLKSAIRRWATWQKRLLMCCRWTLWQAI